MGKRTRNGIRMGAAAALVACAVAAGGLLAGCSSGETQTATDATATASSTINTDIDISGMDFTYTDRDKRTTWDDDATVIELSGTTAAVSGSGATVSGGTVTITDKGSYVVSGELTQGQLVVNAGDNKVQVVLNGVSIYNATGPALLVEQADKCFVTLAEGSSNTLTAGTSFTLETDSDEPNATVFSKDDITFNGTGALTVTGDYHHAIRSKDDLVITGGDYTLTATASCLSGKDCVKILDGNFNLTAGADGIVSTRDDDATKGFVSIDGGTFAITSVDKGVQAEKYLRIAGGTFAVTSTDDALHSNLQGAIEGGTFTLNAGDDAVHTESILTIDGGTIDVPTCYEGLESEKIYVNAGTVNIVARDDAINASGMTTSTTANVSTTGQGTAAAGATVGTQGGGTAAGGTDPGAAAAANGEVPELPDDVDMGAGAGAGGTDPGAQAAQGGTMPDAQGGNTGGQAGQGAVTPPSGDSDPGAGRDANESTRNGGQADNAFAEGMGGGTGGTGGTTMPGMGDENCLIQINGGTLTLESVGDTLDSNGSIEITGGTVLVNGPTSDGDAAFDYDLTSTISGGTVLMVGSSGMAQNFTSGTQPFAFQNVNGNAGDEVSVTDASGKVLVSMTATKRYENVLVSTPEFTEGGTYTLTTGSTETSITASCTATGGMGGLGADGNPMAAGKGGDVQQQRRR